MVQQGYFQPAQLLPPLMEFFTTTDMHPWEQDVIERMVQEKKLSA